MREEGTRCPCGECRTAERKKRFLDFAGMDMSPSKNARLLMSAPE